MALGQVRRGLGAPLQVELGQDRADVVLDRLVGQVDLGRDLLVRLSLGHKREDTLLLAEAFWLMEGYFVRTLGMHRVYNSAFMNMLKEEDNANYRQTLKNVLEFSPAILQRFVNFMNNPDEDTAQAQFGKGDKYFGVAAMLVTMPGLPMFGHGQIEGFAEKYGMEYRRAYHQERPDGWLIDRHEREISVESFEIILREMVVLLEAQSGYIEMNFPYFVNKTAPISGVQSLLDYDVTLIGEMKDGDAHVTMKVLVPVTSLCPCSKKISERGAHNQRSHVTITLRTNSFVWIEDVVDIAEKQASCELYGLLKRPDEKYVTERAYDNPKFVEDMVRDVAAVLNADERIDAYTIESENFESIHNHSAYALIERDKTKN